MKKTLNIGEKLSVRDEYLVLSKNLYQRIIDQTTLPSNKIVIAIGGESGCGKSTTAFCLANEFLNNDIYCTMLHMDSYFKLPPKENHQNRLKSLENVGPHEVDMDLLNEHITAFKNNQESIDIPVVNYEENSFTSKKLDLLKIDILIVEGVYSFLLKNINHKIFLSRTYHDTYQNRKKRTRENYDPFMEQILEIEHKLVRPMIEDAELIITENYTLK